MADTVQLDKAIREWAETRARLKEMEAELKDLKKEVGDRETYITQVMEQLGQEIRRVDSLTVKVKKKNEGGRAKYKDSFLFLYGKVNQDLKNMADSFLESTKGDKWVKTWLQVESTKLSEGVMKRLWSAVTGWMRSVMDSLRTISSDIDDLEDMVGSVDESELTAKADWLIESAVE